MLIRRGVCLTGCRPLPGPSGTGPKSSNCHCGRFHSSFPLLSGPEPPGTPSMPRRAQLDPKATVCLAPAAPTSQFPEEDKEAQGETGPRTEGAAQPGFEPWARVQPLRPGLSSLAASGRRLPAQRSGVAWRGSPGQPSSPWLPPHPEMMPAGGLWSSQACRKITVSVMAVRIMSL